MTLPTFDGEKDKTLGRGMLAAVEGPDGIRTRISSNAFGSKTMLRTRNGMPEFTTVRAQEGTGASRRGFVAYVRGSRYGALFDPYTLEVLDPKYRLVGALYSVQDFATGWNVSPTDATHWYDTIVFDGEVVKVNAKAMPLINSPSGGASGTIPFLRKASATEPYGNRVLNATQKRVFAVGRETVQAWGGSGAVQTLTPTAPRAEDKAMTLGPKVDSATHVATLGQLFYSGDSWDDLYGEWGFSTNTISMMLTTPYLSKVHSGDVAALPVAPFDDGVGSTSAVNNATTLPPAVTVIVAASTMSSTTLPRMRVIKWGWSGVLHHALAGHYIGSQIRTRYTATAEKTVNHGGKSIVYSASNIKDYDLRSEVPWIDQQTIPFADHTFTLTSEGLDASATELYWGQPDPEVPSTRGSNQFFTFGRGAAAPSTSLSQSRNYETQNGTFSVTIDGIPLVTVTMYREFSYGEKVALTANENHYDVYLANPYAFSGVDNNSGFGFLNHCILAHRWYPGSDFIPIDNYKKNPHPPPNQLPDVEAEIEAKFDARAAQYLAQTCYDQHNPYIPPRYYYQALTSEEALSATLTWDTKDYLFQDDTNEVYILVEGHFSGSGTSASLVVTLKVQTRHHTVTQTLYEQGYTYTELLPEKLIDPMAGDVPLNRRIPSPQIRAMHAPLYQEQGSFKGAHYVTAAEEANGALPFHGFNFVLVLQPYDAVSSCNDDNLGTQVFMVPCNLLEMLYAFVFSQEYGVSEYYRYPVSFLQRYTDIMSGASALFNVARRVQIRNGVVSNWVGNLGTAYANAPTTELYRT